MWERIHFLTEPVCVLLLPVTVAVFDANEFAASWNSVLHLNWKIKVMIIIIIIVVVGSRGSVFDKATWLRAGSIEGSKLSRGQKLCSSPRPYRPAVRLTQPPIPRILQLLHGGQDGRGLKMTTNLRRVAKIGFFFSPGASNNSDRPWQKLWTF